MAKTKNAYSEALDQKGWSDHYNLSILESVLSQISTGNVSVWSKELCNITSPGERVLEIGCGTGASSLWLAKNGRNVTALDYTESSVELVKAAVERLQINNIEVIRADATQNLPFEDNSFDMAFQSGLLEHFETAVQIDLLTNWKRVAKRVVSMIPNAASVPYRVGKQIMEENGAWAYGLEIPKSSLASEFHMAGLSNIREYSIGTEWALSFLPSKHFLHKYYKKLFREGYDLDGMMQGYLLVTIGDC